MLHLSWAIIDRNHLRFSDTD